MVLLSALLGVPPARAGGAFSRELTMPFHVITCEASDRACLERRSAQLDVISAQIDAAAVAACGNDATVAGVTRTQWPPDVGGHSSVTDDGGISVNVDVEVRCLAVVTSRKFEPYATSRVPGTAVDGHLGVLIHPAEPKDAASPARCRVSIMGMNAAAGADVRFYMSARATSGATLAGLVLAERPGVQPVAAGTSVHIDDAVAPVQWLNGAFSELLVGEVVAGGVYFQFTVDGHAVPGFAVERADVAVGAATSCGVVRVDDAVPTPMVLDAQPTG